MRMKLKQRTIEASIAAIHPSIDPSVHSCKHLSNGQWCRFAVRREATVTAERAHDRTHASIYDL